MHKLLSTNFTRVTTSRRSKVEQVKMNSESYAADDLCVIIKSSATFERKYEQNQIYKCI